MSQVYLLLGGNLGDRLNYIFEAIAEIKKCIGDVTKSSSLYQTKAWGVQTQADFLNQALEIRTDLLPSDLLANTQAIENKLGRTRLEMWGERTMDIDILFYNYDIVNLENLIIPHPLIHLRKFVLIPLAEIAPDFIHPVLKKSINLLNSECGDDLEVTKFEKHL